MRLTEEFMSEAARVTRAVQALVKLLSHVTKYDEAVDRLVRTDEVLSDSLVPQVEWLAISRHRDGEYAIVRAT